MQKISGCDRILRWVVGHLGEDLHRDAVQRWGLREVVVDELHGAVGRGSEIAPRLPAQKLPLPVVAVEARP